MAGIVCQHLTVAQVAEALGVAWNTANDAVLAEGKRVLIADATRFDGVRVIGVDKHVWRHIRKHVWRHIRKGDKYVTVTVTVTIDLTGIRDGTGPGPAAGHGPRPFQAGVQDLARPAPASLARRGADRGDGREA